MLVRRDVLLGACVLFIVIAGSLTLTGGVTIAHAYYKIQTGDELIYHFQSNYSPDYGESPPVIIDANVTIDVTSGSGYSAQYSITDISLSDKSNVNESVAKYIINEWVVSGRIPIWADPSQLSGTATHTYDEYAYDITVVRDPNTGVAQYVYYKFKPQAATGWLTYKLIWSDLQYEPTATSTGSYHPGIPSIREEDDLATTPPDTTGQGTAVAIAVGALAATTVAIAIVLKRK